MKKIKEAIIKLSKRENLTYIVGTGGDGSNSFNISTTSSMVIAAGGVPVARHGNRAASSKSGAADVLEALGVKITLSPEKSAEILKKINICFLFAQNYHIAMKYVAPIRKELSIRTVFNILGPLSNPAGANMELMGVFDESLVEPLARVMANLGVTRGMVVYGQDKLDEISMSAATTVCEIQDGGFTTYEITPEQFGYTRCAKAELTGGTPEENAEITRSILNGEEKGAKRQAVCLNAGAALYIAGKADSLEAGMRKAEHPGFLENLLKPGMSYICEVKKASPSKGVIAEEFPYLQIAREYEAAGARAISCGVTTDKIFAMVEEIRKTCRIPLVFMTYANVVFSYGTERFMKKAAEVGMDGLILPDVPFEEKEEFDAAAKAEGLDLISLISPTSHERITKIAREAEGFVYCVSSLGVTGTRSQITTDIAAMVRLVKEVKNIPCAVGFGISTPEQAKKMASQSDGAIVGSAIVKLCAKYGADCVPYVQEYVRQMKKAVIEDSTK